MRDKEFTMAEVSKWWFDDRTFFSSLNTKYVIKLFKTRNSFSFRR
jgi:hypothetical protein